MRINVSLSREAENIVVVIIQDNNGEEIGSIVLESRSDHLLVDVFRDENTLVESVKV